MVSRAGEAAGEAADGSAGGVGFCFRGKLKIMKDNLKKNRKICEVRDIRIGEGMPKICIPITGINVNQILSQGLKIMRSPADLIEWRADYFRKCTNKDALKSLLGKLNDRIEGRPLLMTLRTSEEGGCISISDEEYIETYKAAMSTGFVDMIDVQYMKKAGIRDALLTSAAEYGVKVIFSYHDFSKTPDDDFMTETLIGMQSAGADIAKIAFMPQNPSDVLRLMSVTEKVSSIDGMIPIITISMSAMGIISRISGETFGSAVTFATAGESSAPGQLDADEVDRIMVQMHRNLRAQDFSGEVASQVSSDDGKSQALSGEVASQVSGGDGKSQALSSEVASQVSGGTKRKNIVLTGFMGSGKTTVAKKLHKKKGLIVKEIDDMIEQSEGMKISRIFEVHGEEYFRQAETRQTKVISKSEGVVVSCGGGTVLRPKNVEYLKKNGIIILLDASPDLVYTRVKNTGDKRPLLKKHMSRGFISWLMKKRDKAYRAAADIVIPTDGMSSEQVAEKIIEICDL